MVWVAGLRSPVIQNIQSNDGNLIMKQHVVRKYGRRKAGSYGRPSTPKMKRAASKAVRRLFSTRKESLND
mgnify:CR=1 FL=1